MAQARAAVAERMSGRLGFVGSNATTRPLIEASFKRMLEILDGIWRRGRSAGRPAGDGRLRPVGPALRGGDRSDAGRDHAGVGAERDGVGAAHDVAPKAEGPFESWSSLSAGLMPLLTEEVGRLFLPWSAANAEAIAKGDKSFTMTLAGAEWSQEPQKYHARSLQEIRRKYAAAKGAPGLGDILVASDCLRWL